MIFQEQKHVTVCALNCFCCYAMLELLVLLDNCVNDVCVPLSLLLVASRVWELIKIFCLV